MRCYMNDSKKCSVCQVKKDESCFAFKNKKLGKLHSKCRQCQAEYHREHYLSNKKYYSNKRRLNNQKYRTAGKIFINDYKATKGCHYCNEKTPCCLDFHHLDPNEKDSNISQMKGHARNISMIKKEVEKKNSLKKLIKKMNGIKYDFYGIGKQEPVWGNEFYKSLLNSKMALNLSRGEPTKHYSSNRIASLMGNGLLVFIDKKVKMNNFFSPNEIVSYSHINELAEKIKFYKKNNKLRTKIAKNGKKKYFKLFNESKISKYIIDKSLGKKVSLF